MSRPKSSSPLRRTTGIRSNGGADFRLSISLFDETEPETKDSKKNGGQPKADDNFWFFPTTRHEPKMERGDSKEFLASEVFGEHLDCRAENFENKNPADDGQSKDFAGEEADNRQRGPKS